jgi:hypothetical protein
MGITVPSYTITGGQTLENAYISCRFETIAILYNTNGTYNIHTTARVYTSPTDIFTQDSRPFGLTITKDQLSQPIHTILYTYLKTQYPGATDSI